VTALVAMGGVAKAWLVMLAMVAAQGTVLALLALALTRAGRLRPSWQAAIWLVVIVKFALPWSPALPWSLADLIAALTAHGGDAAATAMPALAQAPVAPVHAAAMLGWLAVGIAWAMIAATIITRAVVGYRRTVRAARRALPAPTSARVLLAELAARAGVRAPMLVVGDGAVGPHVVGIVRATIVVPPALIGEPALLRATLLHELAHVRRRDGLARAVQVWAGALVFFWPVVRVVARRLDLARESACDVWALESGELARPAYARLLVRMAELRAAEPALAAPRALDARITAVLGAALRPGLGRMQRIALVAWGLLALGGARAASAHGDHPSCKYTPELAQALFLAHPEADLDGDGVLSRDEACELQAELRRHADDLTSELDPELETFLTEPLCCNCDRPEANSRPESASCHQAEGVDR
jgi:beta-lactamase regulating signal transducer with metallopeptidase domain